jgi:hypothetical protein
MSLSDRHNRVVVSSDEFVPPIDRRVIRETPHQVALTTISRGIVVSLSQANTGGGDHWDKTARAARRISGRGGPRSA